MSDINDTDLFLISRNSTNYQLSASDLMSTIQDNDFMLIQRGSEVFKVSCQDVKEQLGGPPYFSSVDMVPLDLVPSWTEDNDVTCITNVPEVGGIIPAAVSYDWYYYDNASGEDGKVFLEQVNGYQSESSITLPREAAEKFVGCTVTYLNNPINENQRCAVAAFPPVPVIDVDFLMVGGGSLSYGVGQQAQAGGGGGGVITSISGEMSSGGAGATSTLRMPVSRSTYSVVIGTASNDTTMSGPSEPPQAGDDPAFSHVASAAYTNTNPGEFGADRGGKAGRILINGAETEGYAGGGRDQNGNSSACWKQQNGCDPVCEGMAIGGGGGAGGVGTVSDPKPSGQDGGDGVYTTITGNGMYVAGGGYGSQGCYINYGTGGQGYENYGGGGVEQGAGQDGVIILRYPNLVEFENPGGGLAYTTSWDGGDYKVTTITAGIGTIRFNNA